MPVEILHIAAECYPAAKVGGLGDVVGALPKYLQSSGIHTGVVMPKYRTPWLESRKYEEVYRGTVRLHAQIVPFLIERVVGEELGFGLYVANIPGKFDRPGVYSDSEGRPYRDEVARNLSFQMAVLQWVNAFEEKPAVLHCHDHHTGLIPFMVQHCPEFEGLSRIPTVFTIHNGMYQGAFSWRDEPLLPLYYASSRGLLDWSDAVNPMASAIRCAWRVTTVSPGYLQELREFSLGLEKLFQWEWAKCSGVLNGIDHEVWDPATDAFLDHRLQGGDWAAFKADNKRVLCERFNIRPDRPLFTFIGRLVREKGADIIPEVVKNYLYSGREICFVVLGSGDAHLSDVFRGMKAHFPGFFDCSIEYNERLSHQLYAGSDFLFMPSRVEPCGLNQLYAMRYGTVPVVRATGGLRDTVPDVGDPDGRGVRFLRFDPGDAWMALHRAAELYWAPSRFQAVRERIAGVDFSWEKSVAEYLALYRSLR
jgi:starch synthase